MARREAPLVYIKTDEWVAFKKVLDRDRFGKALASALRRQLKELGAEAVDAVGDKLDEPTPGGNQPGDGLDAIKQSLKTVVSFNRSAAGVRITASASRLDKAHKGLLNVYNKPVFKNPRAFTGRGNPYFGSVIYEVATKEFIEKMRAAMRVATNAIGARGE